MIGLFLNLKKSVESYVPFRSGIHKSQAWWFLCIFTIIPLTIAPVLSLAQAPEAAKPSDVRILVDISGSMKKNDPQNLRQPAVDMLAKLLPEGSKAGVWNFGQYVNMLVKHRPVDKAWKQEANTKKTALNSVAQFTNIGEALEKAAYDKHYSNQGTFQTHVILLTDGMVDIHRDPAVNKRERTRILNDILPLYKQANYTIHTISLSDKADKKLMDRLALATNGQSVVAKTADELMDTFLQVFDQAVPKEEVPLDGNTFATDSSIEEFTALIFRQPNSPETRLLSPDQSEYTQSTQDPNVNWYRTDRYDLITIKRPLEGEWRIIAELEPQSRVTVVSDLSLVVKALPTNILLDDVFDLSLVLREENIVVKPAEFLELLDIDVNIKHLDSKDEWNQRLSDGLVPGNGVYTAELAYFKKVGQYEIVVSVDGKSFQRRFSHRATVRHPFLVETATIEQDSKTFFRVTVTPQIQTFTADKTQVVGKLKDPSGASNIRKFQLNDEHSWELLLSPKAEGTYHLTLRITTESDAGEIANIIPKPISFKYPPVDDLFETLDDEKQQDIDQAITTPKKATPKKTGDDVVSEPEEPVDNSEETLEEQPNDDGKDNNWMQWAFYAALAAVNILIILVLYILYRKLFRNRSESKNDESKNEDQSKANDAKQAETAPAFEEPPMDEMAIDDLSDDVIDLAEDDINLAMDNTENESTENESTENESTENENSDTTTIDKTDEEDSLADLTTEALDDEDSEFSLDDFAPDALDDDDDNLKT